MQFLSNLKLSIIRLFYLYAPILRKLKPNVGIIVSFTSYPARFNTIYASINSVFKQSLRPDLIVLYLDEDVPKEQLPTKVLKLQNKGLIIKNVPETIKPHKKYLFAFQEYEDKIVVTVDDDMVYRRDTIRLLFDKHTEYPKSVVARRVHRITESEGKINPYNQWNFEDNTLKKPSHLLFALGVGAVLYPVSIFPKETFNLGLIKKLSLSNDDIWLKGIEIKYGIPVVKTDSNKQYPYPIEENQTSALMNNNYFAELNNELVKNVFDHFNIDLTKME